MKFSSIIYPAPSPPSYTHDKLIGELLYIPERWFHAVCNEALPIFLDKLVPAEAAILISVSAPAEALTHSSSSAVCVRAESTALPR